MPYEYNFIKARPGEILNCFYIFQEDEKRTKNEISSRNLDYVEFDHYIFDYWRTWLVGLFGG